MIDRHSQSKRNPPICYWMGFLKIWHAMIRATAALLLMAALATPALAEIGCAEESVVHLQDTILTDYHGDAIATNDQSDDDQQKVPAKSHCAFNHGHCAGIPVNGSAAVQSQRLAVSYGIPKAMPLTAASIENPERPPNA